jgi:hypothetical protein
VVDPTNYNRILCFRVNTQAFYIFSITDAFPKLKDIFTLTGTSRTLLEDTVVTNTSDNVVNDLNDQVIIQIESLNSIKTSFKFLVVIKESGQPDKMTFGGFDFTDPLQDWTTYETPLEYPSFFTSSFKLRGEGQRPFQVHYVTVFSKTIVNSSAFMSTIWNYVNNPSTGHVTNKQQAIKYDSDKEYNTRRLLIRGQGVAVQFKFESEGTKPFNIIGWATSESVNDRV